MSFPLGGTYHVPLGNLNKLLEKILHLKALREYGFQDEDIDVFSDSVIENQQRLVVNSYVPLTKALIKEIYAECL